MQTRLPTVAIFDDYWAATLTFANSLGRQGVPLHFYGSGAGHFSRYCTAHLNCPPLRDAARFLLWLRDQVRSGAITRVAPTSDLIAYYVSSLREEFPPSVQRTIPPLAEIETCLIKTRFALACRGVGQTTPDTLAPDSVAAVAEAGEALRYPLILKPKSHLVVGSRERGHLIRNAAELLVHYRPYAIARGQEALAERYPELRWPLLQRYIPSANRCVYSVTGLKDPEKGVVVASLSFKREQWPPHIGVSTAQISHQDTRILRAGVASVDRLLSRGIFELELLDDGGQLLAIDLNPRAFGFIALDVALGADLPYLWLRSTLEALEPLAAPISAAIALEARHRTIRFFRGLIGWPSIRSQHRERRRNLRACESISMVGNLSDPVPMLISNLHALQAMARHLLRSLLRIRPSA